jgi:two-component system, LytTR family, sensor kinase
VRRFTRRLSVFTRFVLSPWRSWDNSRPASAMLQPAQTPLRESDHPSSRSTWTTGLLASAWLLVGTLSYARIYVQRPDQAHAAGLGLQYLAWLTCYLPWVALTPLVVRLERRFPLGGRDWGRHLAVLALAGLPAALVASALALAMGSAGRTLLNLPVHLPDPIWAPPELLGHGILYGSTVGVSWVVRTLLDAREHERQTARLLLEKSQLESSLRQADLDALRSRLDPHFLFNSLQNISVLVQDDPTMGSRMLTRLGDLLRVSLRREARSETTLRAEIELAQTYLAIEQMRFGDRLSARVTLDPRAESALVPAFLLQPLIENAIRHGLDPVQGRGCIEISSRIEADVLALTVSDNGAGPPTEPLSRNGMGIGLGATCRRLELMYPDRHTFALMAAPGRGTQVRITLPLRFERTLATTEEARLASADRRR